MQKLFKSFSKIIETPFFVLEEAKSDSQNKDSKKTRKTKSGAKMSSYQVHVADCRGGKGKFEGQGTKDFEQCVEIWNNLKKNTGD